MLSTGIPRRFVPRACRRALTASLLCGFGLAGQDVSGPTLGFVHDSTRNGLRIVSGVPGASRVSALLNLDAKVVSAIPSAQQDFALVLLNDDRVPALVRWQSGQPVVQRLEVVPSGVSRLAISAGSQTAAFYYATGRKLITLGKLNGEPAIIREATLPEGTEVVSDLSVSNDGKTVLVAISGDGSSILAAVQEDGTLQKWADAQVIAGISLSADGDTAYLADSTAKQVVSIHRSSGGLEPAVLLRADDGLQQPVAVLADGNQVWVADAGSSSLLRRTEAGEITAFPCHCVPQSLQRLRGKGLFQLTGGADGPLWMAETGASEPRILFAAPSEVNQ